MVSCIAVRSRAKALVLALALLACVAAACTPDFQVGAVVVDLRVLAVRADPPEAFVDLQKGTVASVTAHVLVADPNAGGQDATVNAALCFPTDTLLCDPGSPALPQTVAGVGDIALPPISIPAALVAAALQNDQLKGLGGVRVQLALSVATRDPNGPVKAEKTLLYSDSQTPNHNPTVAGLLLTQDGTATMTLAPGQTLALPVGQAVGLRPSLPCADDAPGGCAGGEEHYTAIDFHGNAVALREEIAWAFFSTAGASLDRDSADEPLPELQQSQDGLVRISAQAAGRGTFWVVGRDGRGGIGWLVVPWTAQ